MIPINFILGFARSGTTLTMGLCRTHKDIETDVQEPNHVFRLMDSIFLNYKGYEDEIGLSMNQVHNMYFNSVKDFTQSYYSKLCAKTNKKVVVLKHPWLTRWIERVGNVYHKSKMLVMIRHPYDVIASALHMTELSKSAEQMFGGIGNVDKICKQYSEHMGAILLHAPRFEKVGRCKLLKYEDLVKKPHEEFEDVLKFFGVEHDADTVLDIIKKAEQNKGCLKGVCLSRTSIYKPVDKWKERLDEHQRHRIRSLISPFVWKFGYENK